MTRQDFLASLLALLLPGRSGQDTPSTVPLTLTTIIEADGVEVARCERALRDRREGFMHEVLASVADAYGVTREEITDAMPVVNYSAALRWAEGRGIDIDHHAATLRDSAVCTFIGSSGAFCPRVSRDGRICRHSAIFGGGFRFQ